MARFYLGFGAGVEDKLPDGIIMVASLQSDLDTLKG